MKLRVLFDKLLKIYGSQDWWPSSDYFTPREWEICLGAILTQNTSWKNVEKALNNMKKYGVFSPEEIIKVPTRRLFAIIKPSGFYRQKSKRLKMFARFALGFGNVKKFLGNVTREDLLSISGIGPETADSILLYACNKPYFVIDAYTRRLLNRMKIIDGNEGYDKLQDIFHKSLPQDVKLYKEFHALIVEHAKRVCRNEPKCYECFLKRICKKTG